MSMTNEEKIKKMNEVKDEYFRRMQVLRDEHAKLVQELIAKRDAKQKESILNNLSI